MDSSAHPHPSLSTRWRAFLARTALPPLWVLGLFWGAAVGLEALRHRQGWGVLACGAAVLVLSGLVGATVGRSRRERLWLTLPCVLMLGSTVLQLSLMRSWHAHSANADMYGMLAQYFQSEGWAVLRELQPKSILTSFLSLPFVAVPGVILFAVLRKGLAGEGAPRLEPRSMDALGFARFWLVVSLLFLPFPGRLAHAGLLFGSIIGWGIVWWKGLLRGPPSPELEARWNQQLVTNVLFGGLPLMLCLAIEARSGYSQLGQDSRYGSELAQHLRHWLSLVWPLLLLGLLVPVLKAHEGARRWALALCVAVPLTDLCLALLQGAKRSPAGMMPVTLAGLAGLGLAFLPVGTLRFHTSGPRAAPAPESPRLRKSLGLSVAFGLLVTAGVAFVWWSDERVSRAGMECYRQATGPLKAAHGQVPPEDYLSTLKRCGLEPTESSEWKLLATSSWEADDPVRLTWKGFLPVLAFLPALVVLALRSRSRGAA